METCKDCIHYDVCSLEEGEILIGAKKNGFCGKHKDKSRFIELRCKVGDTVYSYCETFGVILPYFVEVFIISYCDKNEIDYQYEANCHSSEEDELLDDIDFEIDDIGKTVFITREEAERALKEK